MTVARHIPHHPADPATGAGPLGRHVHHDPLSRNFPARTAPVIRTVYHRRYGKALDQGNLGGCTGWSAATACNVDGVHRTGAPLLGDRDGLRLYERATVLDPFPGAYPPTDTGSDGLSVCKALVEEGRIAGYTWTFSLADALGALMLGPVLTGVNWYEGFDRPDAEGVIHIAGDIRGSHEVVVTGYDARRHRVRCNTTWGHNWPTRGAESVFLMHVDTWGTLLDQQGDVTAPRR